MSESAINWPPENGSRSPRRVSMQSQKYNITGSPRPSHNEAWANEYHRADEDGLRKVSEADISFDAAPSSPFLSDISPIADDLHIHRSVFRDTDGYDQYDDMTVTKSSPRRKSNHDRPRTSTKKTSQQLYEDDPAQAYSCKASPARPSPLENILPDYLLEDNDMSEFHRLSSGEMGDQRHVKSKSPKSSSSRRSSLSAKVAVTPYRDWYDRRNMSRIFRAQRSPAARRSLIQHSVEVHENSGSGLSGSCHSLVQGEKSASFRYLAAFKAALDGNSMDLMGTYTFSLSKQ
ncbi:hypothetical protein EC973_008602, partial [Apophysomyces ossiformis]